MELLANYRPEIVWKQMRESYHSFACKCSKLTQEKGFTHFAIRFYGECWAGKGEFKSNPDIKSNECVTHTWGRCDDETEHECAGKANAQYVYIIANKDGQEQDVDGGYSKWSEFSVCSTSCGVGTKSRERSCTSPIPAGDGKDCSQFGLSTDIVNCKLKECPVNGYWTEWQTSSCSKTCGDGFETKTRTCTNPAPAHGGHECSGESQMTQHCKVRFCPVNGGYSNYGSWSTCTETCGTGTQRKTRTCTNPSPAHGGSDCSTLGPSEETRSCNTQPCPVNGGYSNYGSWSTCTKTCGTGNQRKTRTCTNPSPAHGGNDCSALGPSEETRSCNTQPCPVNGGWSGWGSYGSCSKLCGGGIKQKQRSCNSPTAKYGGASCKGSSVSTNTCNTQKCPIHGGWSSYSSYGSCTKTCGSGVQYSYRYCNNPSPQFGGRTCSGASTQSRSCNTQTCPPRYEYKSGTVCEGKTISLSCNYGGTIVITSSTYGRKSTNICKVWTGIYFSTNCRASSSQSQMTSRCNNRRTCSVKASNSVFGDPCFGTTKYLSVGYKCKYPA